MEIQPGNFNQTISYNKVQVLLCMLGGLQRKINKNNILYNFGDQ